MVPGVEEPKREGLEAAPKGVDANADAVFAPNKLGPEAAPNALGVELAPNGVAPNGDAAGAAGAGVPKRLVVWPGVDWAKLKAPPGWVAPKAGAGVEAAPKGVAGAACPKPGDAVAPKGLLNRLAPVDACRHTITWRHVTCRAWDMGAAPCKIDSMNVCPCAIALPRTPWGCLLSDGVHQPWAATDLTCWPQSGDYDSIVTTRTTGRHVAVAVRRDRGGGQVALWQFAAEIQTSLDIKSAQSLWSATTLCSRHAPDIGPTEADPTYE